MTRIRLAIHHDEGSYSDRWIAYCKENDIPFKIVNCLGSNIISELASTDALLWHWNHLDPREQLVARNVLHAAEMMGIMVFPNLATCWHFDDKIAQKYMLEAVGAPLVPTYVFYDLNEALDWIKGASFPKVFKLRRGAASSNVRLVRDPHEARQLTMKAFGGGFNAVAPYYSDARRKIRAMLRRGDILSVIQRLPGGLAHIREVNRGLGRERGYVYFQDFVPDNTFDTRVTVIGDRIFAFRRNVRPGDFRASGSGDTSYDPSRIRRGCLVVAFQVAQKVRSQSMNFDFVLDGGTEPKIVEVSYCTIDILVYQCPGYWDKELNWRPGSIWPQDAILQDLIENTFARRIGDLREDSN